MFARDIISMSRDDAGDFVFGKPPRPVRGLSLFGIIVSRSTSCVQLTTAGTAAVGPEQGEADHGNRDGGNPRVKGDGGIFFCNAHGDDNAVGEEFGFLVVGESTRLNIMTTTISDGHIYLSSRSR